jgi:hypothetical protein
MARGDDGGQRYKRKGSSKEPAVARVSSIGHPLLLLRAAAVCSRLARRVNGVTTTGLALSGDENRRFPIDSAGAFV